MIDDIAGQFYFPVPANDLPQVQPGRAQPDQVTPELLDRIVSRSVRCSYRARNAETDEEEERAAIISPWCLSLSDRPDRYMDEHTAPRIGVINARRSPRHASSGSRNAPDGRASCAWYYEDKFRTLAFVRGRFSFSHARTVIGIAGAAALLLFHYLVTLTRPRAAISLPRLAPLTRPRPHHHTPEGSS
jgi:hypothetical protein